MAYYSIVSFQVLSGNNNKITIQLLRSFTFIVIIIDFIIQYLYTMNTITFHFYFDIYLNFYLNYLINFNNLLLLY